MTFVTKAIVPYHNWFAPLHIIFGEIRFILFSNPQSPTHNQVCQWFLRTIVSYTLLVAYFISIFSLVIRVGIVQLV